jgi:hypothetical protein
VPAGTGAQLVGLRDVRQGAAQQPEGEAVRALEADGLDGRRGDSPGGGHVRRECHVAAALPHVELVLRRAWSAAQVGTGDHVEDGLGRGGDRALDRTERPDAAADTEVERERPADEERVTARPAASRSRTPRTRSSYADAPRCRRRPSAPPVGRDPPRRRARTLCRRTGESGNDAPRRRLRSAAALDRPAPVARLIGPEAGSRRPS